MTAEDFLLRRSTLHLKLSPEERDAIRRWFDTVG